MQATSELTAAAFPWRAGLAVLFIALIGRILLLASHAVSFHSDEAIIGLMARHILAGERPTFFYGQAYMGSLDAWLVALGFRLWGESILSIRLTQSLLYLAVVASGIFAAWALTLRRDLALISGLMLAIPPTLAALYTTATLGGYNETLLFGHLLLGLSGFARWKMDRIWHWAAFGLITGIGWWANALIIVYAAPAALFMLLHSLHRQQLMLKICLALALFIIGSAPWWVYALQNNLEPIRFFLPDILGSRETVGAVIPSVPWDQRLIGLLLFGLPTTIGLRFPWSGEFFAWGVGLLVIGAWVAAWIALARRHSPLSGVRGLLIGMVSLLFALFLLTRFSSDPSGRYFLPLIFPLNLIMASWIVGLPRRFAALILLLILGYFAAGQLDAARSSTGLTTQFVSQTHLPNDDDAALIAWLEAADLQYGYTTYWVSFRLAFLSQERLIYSAALPDKSDLSYTPAFERYLPYRQAVDGASRVAYITAGVPELDVALVDWFAALNLDYAREQIGIYQVYYDFQPETPRPPPPFLR